MKLPYNWVKEYVNFKYNSVELAEALSMHCFEVPNISAPQNEINNVLTGRIKSIEKHPDADKLVVCQVEIGSKEIVQIVSGAANICQRNIVPVALVNATLPGGVVIKRANLRGVESFGMLCSEQELGLADSAAGIMILDAKTPIGKKITQVVEFQDVLDIEILPNRPDCLSIVGLAREISAITGNSLRLPKFPKIIKKGTSRYRAAVAVRDREGCPRYMARLIESVKVAESPPWLKDKLLVCGIKPINNIVDITNFVLLETGQPLHVFDFKKLEGGQINVRNAYAGEKIKLLSGDILDLKISHLVIADKKKPVALAGIMGGEDTKVTEKTKTILLESAYFNPVRIGETSKKLDLRTDSSLRFEKGVDWAGVENGFKRAVSLIVELAEGVVVSDNIDEKRKSPEPLKINLRLSRLQKVLGINIPEKDVLRILANLDFAIEPLGDLINVEVPSFRRRDIYREIDIIEEVSRIYGYDKIKETLPVLPVKVKAKDDNLFFKNQVKNFFINQGLFEVQAYSLTDPAYNLDAPVTFATHHPVRAGDYGRPVKLTNPLAERHSVMRNHLLGNLMHIYAHNSFHQLQNIKLFEFGTIYLKKEIVKSSSKITLPEMIFEETEHLAGVFSGDFLENNFRNCGLQKVDFYWLKGILENLFELLKAEIPRVITASHPWFHPGQCAVFEGTDLVFGQIHEPICEKYDLKNKQIFAFEGSINKLMLLKKKNMAFSPLPKFPLSRKDIALMVKNNITHEQIISTIKNASGKIVEEVKCFDVYEGEQIQKGFKSLTYAIYYRDPEKTLTDEEILRQHKNIQEQLAKEFSAKIR